jgi:phosphopantetheinyl transferase (holo-ACP synthase)
VTCTVGNDVVDVADPAVRGAVGSDSVRQSARIARHLTDAEATRLRAHPARARRRLFWWLFAAKEAAHKAFAQAGHETPRGGYRLLEVDLDGGRVVHLPTGLAATIARFEADRRRIHCVVTAGDVPENALLLCGLRRVPSGRSPSEEARDALARGLANRFGGSPDRWAVGEKDGAPRLLEAGRWIDASISLSHSGRFAAYCAAVPARR